MTNDTNTLTVEEFGAQSDYATVRVPATAKMSSWSVTMIIVGLIIALSAIYTGASFISGLTLKEAILASFAGNLILCFYAGLMGIIGAREGMSVTMLARHAFGRAGSGLISAIVAISLTGWYAYQCGFFGSTIYAMFPEAGLITNPIAAGIWGGLLMMITAYFGAKGLAALSNFAAPLIFLMALLGAGLATRNAGGIDSLFKLSEAVAERGNLSLNTAIVAVVGAFATGGIIQPDVTRYSKTAKQSLLAAVVGFMVVQFAVILAGYIICLGSGNNDVAPALLITLGSWSLLILIFAQWTTNHSNLYSTSLALCAIFPNLNKKRAVVVVGLFAVAIGATGIVNHFVVFLSILGVFVPPVGGIIIADYFVCKKCKYSFGAGTRYGFLSLPALISWIVACIVGFTLKTGIACINSMVGAFVIYLILDSIFHKNPDKKYVGGFCKENAYGMTTKCEKGN